MKKSNLESVIEQAATNFALEIVNAVRGTTLQELIALQSKEDVAKPARKKPGPKPGKKKAAAKTKAKVVAKVTKKAPAAAKKRVVRNYPKCAYPCCSNNRFVRGKGFCGEHWRMWKAGKIKAAEKYK